MSDRIISARIAPLPRPMPEGALDSMPDVHATTGDGVEHFLFTYYPDELTFRPEEFIGLTLDEARCLKPTKDRDFLTSP